jgi:hypothetical protein
MIYELTNMQKHLRRSAMSSSVQFVEAKHSSSLPRRYHLTSGKLPLIVGRTLGLEYENPLGERYFWRPCRL